MGVVEVFFYPDHITTMERVTFLIKRINSSRKSLMLLNPERLLVSQYSLSPLRIASNAISAFLSSK